MICDSTTPPPDRGFYKINDTTTGHVGKLVMSDPVSGKESVALTATISDGQLVFDAAASAAIKRAAVGTPSPAILYDDDVVFTATELIRAAGGYVKQIRGISGTATLDLYDSVDWAGRKLYTGTVSAGDVIDVNAIALNGVSAIVVGTVSISISHTEII